MKDYRKLCLELFGTDDEAELRKIAAFARRAKKPCPKKTLRLPLSFRAKALEQKK